MLLTSRVVPVQAMPATVLPAIVWAQSAAGSSWGDAVLAFLCSSDGDQGVPSFSAPKAENGRFYSFQNRSMPFLNETEGLLLSPALEGWARCHCTSPGFKWQCRDSQQLAVCEAHLCTHSPAGKATVRPSMLEPRRVTGLLAQLRPRCRVQRVLVWEVKP